MSALLKALETKARVIISLSVLWLALLGTISVISAGEYLPSWHIFYQFLFFGVGILAFTIAASISYEKLAQYSGLLYILALFLLATTIVWGHSRWIKLGPFSLQPYEFAKIAIVIYLASLLAKKRNQNSFWQTTCIPLLTILPPILILICQPHFGACVLLLATTFAMLIITGVKPSFIILSSLICVFLLLAVLILAPYRVQRLTAIFEEDPLGKGYQKNQSIIAIGSGGPWGKGIGNSVMKLGFLPEAHTDFLFAIIAEEFGFVLTCLFVLIPFAVFILCGYSLSFSAASPLAAILAGGLTSLFAIQVFINLATVSIKFVPITGLPLPFFAYGGSSLVSSCLAAGIIYNIASFKETRRSPLK